MAMNDEVKIYGLCLIRLRHQIDRAKAQGLSQGLQGEGRILLESYNSGAIEDIIDILELYDVEEQTVRAVREKLDDLAYTVSVLTGEELSFDFSDEGHLGLYLALHYRVAAGLVTG
ncbi:MAG TPA: hypothetical protein VFG09_12080 [Thermodesulfovibrionales bacterium]|jgi:hypothetical protein|nr:hypothetical protein [Thermodesulfovibrionales bacterium]